jgi:hypothetical protein
MGVRLLIAAGEVASGSDSLPVGVRMLIDAADQVMVVAPRLPSRLDWLASATDAATERADERLQVVLGHVQELGADASGRIGADDPLLALEDAIRDFSPDHLLVALRGRQRAGWQERGLLDAILERFDIPVTVFELPSD